MNQDYSIPSVLVIDDELPICMAVCGLLELSNFPVTYALTVQEGLDYLAKNQQTDIVLLDIDLGSHLTGIDAIPLIKETSRYSQIVMFTSHDLLETGVECIKRGAIDFMTKPFDEEKFLQIAAVALEKKKNARLNDLYFDAIVHDLKNPLQCIVGAHEMLRDETEKSLNSLQRKLFATADEAVRQIQMMIGNILAVSRFENGSLSARVTSFSLRQEIDTALAIFSPLEITHDGTENLTLRSDKDLFLRIACNIVSNALRFATPGSSVAVKIGVEDSDFVRVDVTNSGSYIAPEHQEAVFDKFLAVSPANCAVGNLNYGLGLTFSKMAVEALGGKIWIESREDIREMTFCFTAKNFAE